MALHCSMSLWEKKKKERGTEGLDRCKEGKKRRSRRREKRKIGLERSG